MKNFRKKILNNKQLLNVCNAERHKGKKIVTCNGSFDLFHYGHLIFLEYAKKQGDILIVGLNSDSSIKKYKSENRPIIPEKERSQIIAALEIVDYVYIFDETVPMPFIEAVKPDFHANGAEYGEDCIEAETVKKCGGKIYLVPRVAGLSTTELIQKIKKS
ncbi:MAG: D-glycero-beta-D-manno-heptose 1-phosphate adenylyltransferase [Chlamydiae bacterium]|nr:MAG: D-glycero-beta-D-manno-heptose 1-phosphate adenylyltransferase [Chlamydiota bacterium]